MKIEVSNGELLDKVTILQLKIANIKDSEKSINVKQEFETLQPYADSLLQSSEVVDLFNNLYSINQLLWDVEDGLREKEKSHTFDQGFVELARSVYFLNDKRAGIKKQINILTNSNLIEEKSYEQY